MTADMTAFWAEVERYGAAEQERKEALQRTREEEEIRAQMRRIDAVHAEMVAMHPLFGTLRYTLLDVDGEEVEAILCATALHYEFPAPYSGCRVGVRVPFVGDGVTVRDPVMTMMYRGMTVEEVPMTKHYFCTTLYTLTRQATVLYSRRCP